LPPIARSLAVALSFVILSSPPSIQAWVGGDTRPFIVATIALALVQALLFAGWTSAGRNDSRSGIVGPSALRFAFIGAAALVSGWLLVGASHAWLHQIFSIPHDPQRADMLIVVQEGLRRMAQGRNPYTIYHVPWEAPLPYGPMLWAPFALPMALHADVRFLTVAGELFVPVACAIGAIVAAARGRSLAAAGCVALLAAMTLNPDLERFASIGHTPAYWPLLALFAWLVIGEQWLAAGVVLGLLVVARTTMVAMVPAFAIAVWLRARPKAIASVALVAAAIVVPFLPFAIRDPRALIYALYGSYQAVIKGFVWTSTPWVPHTIGITGVLLSNGLQKLVEPVQIAVMFVVYGMGWMAIKRGHAPIGVMTFALLVFSMTTLWPVTYVYFDVFLLQAAAVAIELVGSAGAEQRRTRWWLTTAALTAALVIVSAMVMLPADTAVDAGDPASRPYLRSGLGGGEREGDRTFAWVEGRHASILLPRRSAAPARIEIVCQPALSAGASAQRVSAVLNGRLAGDATLNPGWNAVAFDVPADAWRIGVNELELSLPSSVSPADAGVNTDRRSLSVAIDRVAVRPVTSAPR
jgi:hypothetical protein